MFQSVLQHFNTFSTQAYGEVKGNNIASSISTGVNEFILNSSGVFQGRQLQFRYLKHFLSPASKTSECVV